MPVRLVAVARNYAMWGLWAYRVTAVSISVFSFFIEIHRSVYWTIHFTLLCFHNVIRPKKLLFLCCFFLSFFMLSSFLYVEKSEPHVKTQKNEQKKSKKKISLTKMSSLKRQKISLKMQTFLSFYFCQRKSGKLFSIQTTNKSFQWDLP